jgi:LEA14-like dessication related protein
MKNSQSINRLGPHLPNSSIQGRAPIIITLSLLILLYGCAGLRLQAPSVTVADIKVMEVNLFEQRYAFKLQVLNPNDMDIPVTGMNFEVKLNNQPFARGVSNNVVNLPRLSETVVAITAVSDLSGFIRQINELRKGNLDSIPYHIEGRLISGSFPDLNFENSGMIGIPVFEEEKK